MQAAQPPALGVDALLSEAQQDPVRIAELVGRVEVTVLQEV